MTWMLLLVFFQHNELKTFEIEVPNREACKSGEVAVIKKFKHAYLASDCMRKDVYDRKSKATN